MEKAFLLVALLAFCSNTLSEQVQIQELTQGISKFSADIYEQCAQSEAGDGNLIISPFSMSMLLTLLSQGTNGKTFDELRKGLYLSDNKSITADQYQELDQLVRKSAGESELSIANRIYVKRGLQLNEDFQTIAVEKFGSDIESVNFIQSNETAQLINRFVEQKTKQKIKNFVKPEMFDGSTRVFLVNAIYLKSKWRYAFKRPHKMKFYSNETESIVVDSLHMEKMDFNFGYLEELDAKGLEITYGNSNFTFLIILPNNRTGLNALEVKLKNYDLSTVFDHLHITKINVEVPKFRVETEIQMIDILKNLGMGGIFGNGADLSNLLNTSESFYVDHVIHKAFIEINEEYTEGAAAQGAASLAKSGGQPKFYADHPFVYYVWDKENQIPILSGHIKKFE